jgi:hypothetical protein
MRPALAPAREGTQRLSEADLEPVEPAPAPAREGTQRLSEADLEPVEPVGPAPAREGTQRLSEADLIPVVAPAPVAPAVVAPVSAAPAVVAAPAPAASVATAQVSNGATKPATEPARKATAKRMRAPVGRAATQPAAQPAATPTARRAEAIRTETRPAEPAAPLAAPVVAEPPAEEQFGAPPLRSPSQSTMRVAFPAPTVASSGSATRVAVRVVASLVALTVLLVGALWLRGRNQIANQRAAKRWALALESERVRARAAERAAGAKNESPEAAALPGDPGCPRGASACAARGARLCTRAEWTAACWGPSRARFPYGSEHEEGRCNEGPVAPAGSFARCRSALGVYDMVGNAAEWVTERMAMGGSGAAATCESAQQLEASTRRPDLGFRCCTDALP